MLFARVSCVLRFLMLVSTLALAACGGGGGGGKGSNLPYTVSPTAITFTATQNGPTPAAQQAAVTVNSGTVYIGVTYSGSMFTANFQVTGGTTGVVTVTPNAPNVAPGTYTGTINVQGCADVYCSSGQVAGSPQVITVTYTVQPRTGFSVMPSSLNFNQVRTGIAPTAQNVSLSEVGGASYGWNATISYQSGSGWLTVNGASQASGASLPSSLSVGINSLPTDGTYTAVIHVTGNGNAIDIPVTYTVREPLITASPASLSFGAITQDAAPVSQDIALSTEGGISTNYSAVVIYGAGASGWLTAPATGSAPNTVTIGVNTTNLNAGTYNATLVLSTATQNLSIGISYTVRVPQLTPSPTQLNFSGFRQAALPPSQSANVSAENNASVSYTTNVTYGSGALGWLTVPAGGTTPGTLAVSVNSTNLNVGNYTATITLQPGNGGAPVSVNVAYQVQNPNLTVTPGQLTFTITNSSVSADLAKSIAIGDSGTPLPWTATSSVSWLKVGTASGTTAGNGSTTGVLLTLVVSELEKINPGPNTGYVTLSYTRPDTSVGNLQVAVSLAMNMPLVNYVAPYVALPNTSKEVILRGSGFSNAVGQTITFGSHTVSSYNIVSDTEIRVTHPSLTIGSYPVGVQNQLGLNRTRANLVVAATPTFTYTAIPTSLIRSRTLFDAERLAIYTNNISGAYGGPVGVPRIERHRFVNGSWVTDSLLLNGAPYDIALTPDGREMIALSPSTLYHIDLSSWAITYQVDLATLGYPYNYSYFSHIAMSNDGNALVHVDSQWITMFRYNVLTKTFALVPGYAYKLYGGISPVASLDGSRILVGQNGISGPLPLYFFDTSTSQFVQALPDLMVGRMSYDRTGTYSLIDGYVYDRQFQPKGLEYSLLLGTISPDGTRAYGFVYGTTGGVLRTYDLTSPTGSGGFTEIGGGITITDSPGDGISMAMTNDGHAVILSGFSNLIIQPVQ